MATAKRRSSLSPILANGEQHFSLYDLAKILPEPVTGETVWRWCVYGMRDVNGAIVMMESFFGPPRRVRRSSMEAYQRFVKRISGYYDER